MTDAHRAALHAFSALRPIAASKARAAPTAEGEVVLLMGLQGSGKSTLAKEWIARGYENLNRDTLGKGLKDVARLAEEKLTAGARRLVLDNTYVSRSSHGRLLSPDELKRGKDNTCLPPMALMRMLKELEVPTRAEGFTTLELRAFVRTPRAGSAGRFVALEALAKVGPSPLPTLIFGWQLDAVGGAALCGHGEGPPSCWCRPPLPGLLLQFAHAHRLDPSQCELHGVTQTHRVMAAVIGARFVEVL